MTEKTREKIETVLERERKRERERAFRKLDFRIFLRRSDFSKMKREENEGVTERF